MLILPYSTHLLATAADCDAALALADDELLALRQQAHLLSQRPTSPDSAAEIHSELLSLRTVAASLTALLPLLAVGPTRQRREVELRYATLRQAQLSGRPLPAPTLARLRHELNLAQTQAQIAATEVFREAVVARKASL